MQLFVRVVEEGSFSAAARFLGVTPSSVSRQVSQLEGELGARLFHRTTRKQSLTEPGEIYFQHAHRIVADLEVARLAAALRPSSELALESSQQGESFASTVAECWKDEGLTAWRAGLKADGVALTLPLAASMACW